VATLGSWYSPMLTLTKRSKVRWWPRWANAGEACTAANRFYLEAPVADELSRRLAERMSALNVGPRTYETTEVGPRVNEDGVSRVDHLVRSAMAEGARAAVGGIRPEREGFFYDQSERAGERPPGRRHPAGADLRPCCTE